ncbi:MAG: hypothetical protein A3J74_10000 [Elusimicrobia bacterium RIFCSPHIGHO2_02_FULL_57_9]|nr:MAG: hypothetical protein A3J74_10000 [Elusimicrobia bacterium RIFCSPHIGHO2_02_FULL_57_9]
MNKEFSAGGLVRRGGKVLMVKVCNLKGEEVWTFPKGHVEKGETPMEAALREVEEETGWRCRLKEASAQPVFSAAYRFQRQGRLVSKRVDWFEMEAVEKSGQPDAIEVRDVQWADAEAAGDFLRYPSDLKLLEMLEK